MAQWPNLTYERLAVRDHTLRPNWAQVQAHAILDRTIRAQLERETAYATELDPVSLPGVEREPPPLTA